MKANRFHILTVNPGSTSTKIGVFNNLEPVFIRNIKHNADELKHFTHVAEQYEFRKNTIMGELKNAGVDLHEIDVIMARGGLIKPIPSGIYEVNDKMLADLADGLMGEHASNLGGLIAADLAKQSEKAKAYIADPVVVDEMHDVARIAGHPAFRRFSVFHALNQKAIARRHANSVNKKYEEINLIVAHMGGGISVGAHRRGKVIDVNNALDGDGPFSPQRSGGLPARQVMEICFGGKHEKEQIERMLVGKGGFAAYLGIDDAYEVEKKAEEGDPDCRFFQEAMAYQVGKYIGSMATTLNGDVEAILLTGGIAHDTFICDYIRNMTNFIAPVIAYPGEDELSALANNGLLLLKGVMQSQTYE